MDQGDAAVWAGAIGMVGTLFGAGAGYFAGKAQARATVDGVKLQLSGQREDALWQARIDAYVLLIAEFNRARMQVGRFVSVVDADRQSRRHLSALGFGTPESETQELIARALECTNHENNVRLRLSREEHAQVTVVRLALTSVVDSAGPWAAARTGGPGNAGELKRTLDQKMDIYRSELDALVERVQERLEIPRSVR